MSIETRKITFADAEFRLLRDDHGTRSLEGYAAKFGVLSHELPGKFRERIDRRAFDRFKDADVRAVIDHDSSKLLGRTKSGTLELTVDERGLRYRVKNLPDTTYAKDLEEQIKRGDVDGCSFAFRCKKDSWGVEDGVSVRTLLDVDLIDVCPTAAPCYPDTEVALRSMSEWEKRYSEDQPRDEKGQFAGGAGSTKSAEALKSEFESKYGKMQNGVASNKTPKGVDKATYHADAAAYHERKAFEEKSFNQATSDLHDVAAMAHKHWAMDAAMGKRSFHERKQRLNERIAQIKS